eukprot:scaffold10720_cov69-Phaeocystis_antarctica.AAC.12
MVPLNSHVSVRGEACEVSNSTESDDYPGQHTLEASELAGRPLQGRPHPGGGVGVRCQQVDTP